MRVTLRSTLVAAVSVSLAAGLLATLVCWGWRSQPAFYTAALEADSAMLALSSNELVEQASALLNDVHKSGEWQALFTADQLNGWLAVDVPKNHANLLPSEIDRPRLLLDRGQIVLACRSRSGLLGTVLTVRLEPYLIRSNELAVRIRSARAGWFPLPLQPLLDQVSRAAADAQLDLHWEQASGDPIAIIELSTRRKDGRVLSVESLEIQAGALYVAGTTRSASWPADEPSDSPEKPVLQAKASNSGDTTQE